MVTAILGVVNEVPVPKETPPVEAAHQFIVPTSAAALNVTVPASQRESGVVLVIIGVVLTVAITAVRGEDVQLLLVAAT